MSRGSLPLTQVNVYSSLRSTEIEYVNFGGRRFLFIDVLRVFCIVIWIESQKEETY